MADIESGPRVFLARVRERLAESGHELLDAEWRGWNAPYRFRCAHGHEAVRSGSHASRFLIDCPMCRDIERLARLQEIARKAGGECLSERYAGRSAMYRFRCGLGHEFEARFSKIVEGTWCRRCASLKHNEAVRDPNGLERLQKLARLRGGKCLSHTYTRLADKYHFRCANGHEWRTSGQEVARGGWCGLCAYRVRSETYLRKDGLDELHRFARDRGGECLADQYDGAKSYYGFRCRRGHEWRTTGARIFRGAWCLSCAYEDRRLGIDAMRELAARHGGMCVSDIYVNNATKLEWECARGHRWRAAPSAVRAGHWCAQCHFLSLVRLPQTRRRRRYEPVDV